MVMIRIGSEVRELSKIDEVWVNKLVGSGGHQVIQIHVPEVEMVLHTQQCMAASGGGTRRANQKDMQVLTLCSYAELKYWPPFQEKTSHHLKKLKKNL